MPSNVGYIKAADGRPLVLPGYDTREQRDTWVTLEWRPGGMLVVCEVDPGIAALAELAATGGAGEPEQPFLPHDTRGPGTFSTDGTEVVARDDTYRGSDYMASASPAVVAALQTGTDEPEVEPEPVGVQASAVVAGMQDSALQDAAHALSTGGTVEPVPVQQPDEV